MKVVFALGRGWNTTVLLKTIIMWGHPICISAQAFREFFEFWGDSSIVWDSTASPWSQVNLWGRTSLSKPPPKLTKSTHIEAWSPPNVKNHVQLKSSFYHNTIPHKVFFFPETTYTYRTTAFITRAKGLKSLFQHQINSQKAFYTVFPHTLSSLTPSTTFKREKIWVIAIATETEVVPFYRVPFTGVQN